MSKKPTNHKSQTKECQFKQKSKQKKRYFFERTKYLFKIYCKSIIKNMALVAPAVPVIA